MVFGPSIFPLRSNKINKNQNFTDIQIRKIAQLKSKIPLVNRLQLAWSRKQAMMQILIVALDRCSLIV